MAKGIKGQSYIVKILLALIYDIYGIVRRLTSGKTLPVIVGILQILTFGFCGILWLIDLICVIAKKDIKILI